MNTITATLRRIYLAPADGEGSDLGGAPALDIESRIAAALSGNEGDNSVPTDGGDDADDNLPQEEENPSKDADPEVDPDDAGSNDDDQTLASILGLDDDKLSYDDKGNVVFNAVIDGKPQSVTIQDLVKSYQLEGHVNQKSMKLENDRREFEKTRDAAYNHLASRLEQSNAMLSMVEQQLMAEFQQIDWGTLRATDPAEWAAQRQYFTERSQQLESVKAQIGQSKNAMTAEQQQAEAAKHQEWMQSEISKMITDNPTWADQSIMAKEVGEIGTFLSNQYGFTPDEVANAMDSRLMRLIRDAHAYRSGKQAIKDKKIPDNVPKFRSPGSKSQNRNDMQKARDAKARKDAIRKSGGSVDAIAAALVDRM